MGLNRLIQSNGSEDFLGELRRLESNNSVEDEQELLSRIPDEYSELLITPNQLQKINTGKGEAASKSDFVFVCYDECDKDAAKTLVVSVVLTQQACIFDPLSRSTNDDFMSLVLSVSSVCLLLLSARSVNSSSLRDRIALVENNKIPIIVLALCPPSQLELDAAMQYTLASLPLFELGEHELVDTGRQNRRPGNYSESRLQHLLYALQLQLRVKQQQNALKSLTRKLEQSMQAKESTNPLPATTVQNLSFW